MPGPNTYYAVAETLRASPTDLPPASGPRACRRRRSRSSAAPGAPWRAIPSSRAMGLIPLPSYQCSNRIRAIVSTPVIPHLRSPPERAFAQVEVRNLRRLVPRLARAPGGRLRCADLAQGARPGRRRDPRSRAAIPPTVPLGSGVALAYGGRRAWSERGGCPVRAGRGRAPPPSRGGPEEWRAGTGRHPSSDHPWCW
jgi:hypothetical protein